MPISIVFHYAAIIFVQLGVKALPLPARFLATFSHVHFLKTYVCLYGYFSLTLFIWLMCAASISSSLRFSGCIFEGCFSPDLMFPGTGLKFNLDPFRVLNALIDKSPSCCSNRFSITFLVLSSCFNIF